MFSSPFTFLAAAAGGGEIDPDAQAFFNRVTAAGGSLTSTEEEAINQLVLDLKAYSVWSEIQVAYPMVGGSSFSCAQNLKSSSFTGTFSSGWTFSSNGAQPDGASAYMDTGYQVNLESLLDSAHISYYSRTNVSESAGDIGAFTTGQAHFLLYDFSGASYNGINTDDSQIGTTFSPTTGFLIGNRPNSSELRYYYRGATPWTVSRSSTSRPTLNVYLGCLNIDNSPAIYSSKQTAFASLGRGLTDTQADNFEIAVQAFQTTLGRQIT